MAKFAPGQNLHNGTNHCATKGLGRILWGTVAASAAAWFGASTGAMELKFATGIDLARPKTALIASFPADSLPLRLSGEMKTSPTPKAIVASGPPSRSLVPLVASVRVNEVPRGERFVLTDSAGAFFMKQPEWLEISPTKIDLATQLLEGESHIRVNDVPGAVVKFDEATLTLSITLRASDLPTLVINGASEIRLGEIPAQMASTILNYQVGASQPGGGGGTVFNVAADLSVRYGDWLFRSQSVRTQSREESRTSRIGSQLILDDRAGARQFIVGDFSTPQVPLASAVQLGGLAWMKNYQMMPYFVRHPTLSLAGAATLPSTVDLYLGDTLVLREQVAPGPFELRNFNYYAGQRNVRLVVRDLTGREQTIAYPYFFTPQGLAAGLHDFSYQVGAQRQGAGSADDRYEKLMFSGFHQYGINDALTIGLRAEGERGLQNIGPSVILRSDQLGLLALSVAASRKAGGGTGSALSADYGYQSDNFNASLRHESRSSNYAGLSAELPVRRALRDSSGSIGFSIAKVGTVSASYLQSVFPSGPSETTWALAFSRPLWKNTSLSMLVRHRSVSEARLEWFLGIQYSPASQVTVSASANQRPDGGRSNTLTYSRSLAEGEGLAYALGLESNDVSGGRSDIISARGQYNTRIATLMAEARGQSGGGSGTGINLSAAGAVAVAPGFFGFGRPMADSFAVVQLSPPLAGVRIYENSQMVGRSNEQGQLVLPNIQSYTNNAISLEDKDIPIEFSVDRVQRSLSPAARSGVVLVFPVVRVQSIVGALMVRQGGVTRPLEYRSFALPAAVASEKILTAKGGEFYIENLAVGTYRARIMIDGRECIFDLTVPKSDASLINLEKVLACDLDR